MKNTIALSQLPIQPWNIPHTTNLEFNDSYFLPNNNVAGVVEDRIWELIAFTKEVLEVWRPFTLEEYENWHENSVFNDGKRNPERRLDQLTQTKRPSGGGSDIEPLLTKDTQNDTYCFTERLIAKVWHTLCEDFLDEVACYNADKFPIRPEHVCTEDFKEIFKKLTPNGSSVMRNLICFAIHCFQRGNGWQPVTDNSLMKIVEYFWGETNIYLEETLEKGFLVRDSHTLDLKITIKGVLKIFE